MTSRRAPTQRRARETVAALVEAAAQVFDRQGYDAGTTNRIAERAGVSIGTLYQYFDDKDALLAAVAERHLDEAAVRLGPIMGSLADDPPASVVLADALAVSIDLHTDHPGVHRLLIDERRLPADFYERVRQLLRSFVDQVTGWVARRDPHDPDPEMTARLLLLALETWAHRAAIEGDLDSDAVLAAATRLLAR